MVQRSCRAFDSSSIRVLPNEYLNCVAVNDTVRCRLAGLPRTGKPDRNCENGSAFTPLIGAGSIATAAAA